MNIIQMAASLKQETIAMIVMFVTKLLKQNLQ